MDIDWLLVFLFFAWGAFCMTLGYVFGMTSKVGPLLRWFREQTEDDGNEAEDEQH
jgi:hypothetical protein